MNESCVTFIHALTPVQAGTGQGVGVIDLPIAREKATNLPYIPGSTVKGTLRDEFESDGSDPKRIFGAATGERVDGREEDGQTANAGAAIFTDQRLLCLPVRSLYGTFAWVTSPLILHRFARDCKIAGSPVDIQIPEMADGNAEIPKDSKIIPEKNGSGAKIYLEDLDLTPTGSNAANLWAALLGPKIFGNDGVEQFNRRFAIVSDDVMNFLVETATEIRARNVLDDDTKSSQNLWYEEALPAETILSGLLATTKIRDVEPAEVFSRIAKLCSRPVQLGGNMTVGRGLCRIILDGKGGQTNGNA